MWYLFTIKSTTIIGSYDLNILTYNKDIPLALARATLLVDISSISILLSHVCLYDCM
jgi:hypothetical protein